MNSFLSWLGIGQTQQPKVVKKQKPMRIAVHLVNGTTVVHYANFRSIFEDGRLSLHLKEGGGGVVADYAAGTWSSVTNGKRLIQKVKK